jgi:peptidoglycan hydrolase-like protein with peptidoglycan-binding domain
MALGLLGRREAPQPQRPRRSALALATVTALLLAGLLVGAVVAADVLSRGTLHPSRSGLAELKLGALAGHVERAVATLPGGQSVPLIDEHGTLVPRRLLASGEEIGVSVTVRRPGALGWILGGSFTKHLSLRTPAARVTSSWLTLSRSGHLHVAFTAPVAAVAVGDKPTRVGTITSLTLKPSVRSGSIAIRLAARSWELLGARTLVTWFPRSHVPLLVATPAPATTISPTEPIRLTFSRSLTRIFGSTTPRITPDVAGRWSRPNSHTLVFKPTGTGFPLAATVSVRLPTLVAANDLGPSNGVSWTVGAGTELRLEQLLAQLGYLPLNWTPAGPSTPPTPQAEVTAAVTPPAGTFTWRYSNMPAQLRALWHPGHASVIVKGAVMSFEAAHGLATDGIAGPMVWHALLAAAVARQATSTPYSYVLVRARTPETLSLYSGGHLVLQTAANTGIPGRTTQLGTFPVFEHIRSGTMSGTNPNGSHYHDPGIPWISYFNGGDAIHGFLRAQYGFPQSLGCVELPYSEAAKVWPYTPIGTLVTVTS